VPTILVVDDEWAIADWLQAIISDMGHDAIVASNGKKALDLLKTRLVDLIVTDYMMPIMDGPALVTAIKADPAIAGIPVIIMTALPENVVRERVPSYFAYLQKPFHEPQLLELIQNAFRSAQS